MHRITTFLLCIVLFADYKHYPLCVRNHSKAYMLVSATKESGDVSRKMYNKQADNWSRTEPRCLSDFTGRPVVFSMLEPHILGATVLDIGCGEGYCARKVREMGAVLVVGSDISEAMVRCATESSGVEHHSKNDSENNGRSNENETFHFYCASSCNLLNGLQRERENVKSIPEKFDVAMAIFLFNYLNTDEMMQTMSQIYSALKPGGIFVFSVPHPSMIYCHEKAHADRISDIAWHP